MSIEGPEDVDVLAAIFIMLAFFGILGGLVLLTSTIPQIQFGKVAVNVWAYSFISSLDPFSSFGFVMILSELFPNTGILWMIALSCLSYGAISIPISIGLLSKQRWGRYTALIFGIIVIIASLIFTGLFLSFFVEIEPESTQIIFLENSTITPIILNLIIMAIGITLVVYLLVKYKLE